MHKDSPQAAEDRIEIEIKGRPFWVHRTLLGAPYPQLLSLESTNFCNLSCSHCGHSQFPEFKRGHLDMKYFDAVEYLLGSKIRGISLSNFGEPFVSKPWNILLRKSLAIEGIHISFITNGLLLDKHLEEILDPRISIAVSIDGASGETYGHFRGKDISKLTDNLDLLKSLKAAKKVDYPQLTFLFTVSRINCHELAQIVEVAKKFDVATVIVQFQVFFNHGRFKNESLFFAREDYDTHIALARDKAMELGVNLVHPDSFNGETIVPRESLDNYWLGRDREGAIRCFSQASTCYIRYNGVVEACCAPDHNVMGDLNSESFEDIWHGPHYRELRLSFDRGEWSERCRRCPLIQAIDVHDERAHFIALPEIGPDIVSVPLSYRITEIDSVYRQAVALLPDSYAKAFEVLSKVADLDVHLYEISNLVACLQGMLGKVDAMRRQLMEVSSIAPKDDIISHNLRNVEGFTNDNWVGRFFKALRK
jgi:MoaA/NifB/PqqE/SkfB family radical SAM enzyme